MQKLKKVEVKKLTSLLVASFQAKLELERLDRSLDKMADWAQSSSPKHKIFLTCKKKIQRLEAERRSINYMLSPFGIKIA